MKYQVLFSLNNNEKVFINVVCCSHDWHFKGYDAVEWNLKLLWKIAIVKQKKNELLCSVALPHVFQTTMNIPSLLDLGMPTRTLLGLKTYACQQCHKQFGKMNSLKRHIMDKHVKNYNETFVTSHVELPDVA